MTRGMQRMLALGLLAGGLSAVGCGELSGEAGRPHTPIQEKYQDGAAGAASERDGREGVNMPDWQNHPTMGQGEEEALQGPTGADSRLEPRTPTIPAPEDEQAIGGAGNAGQQGNAGTQDAGTHR